MDRDRLVTLRLPEPLLLALGRAARLRAIPVTDLVRALLAQGVGDTAGHLPDLPVRAPLARDFAEAADWVDLQQRLRRSGVTLRCAGDAGLALHDWPADRYLMPLDRIGQDEAALVLRFAAPFPGRCKPQPARSPGHAA